VTTLFSDVAVEFRPHQDSRADDPRRGGDGVPATARTAPTTHVAPFNFTGLARALRPRPGRGRHVSGGRARHRSLPARPAADAPPSV
jgi:hypothetical protein